MSAWKSVAAAFGVAALIVVALYYAQNGDPDPNTATTTTPGTTTTLIIEMVGGFAYVPIPAEQKLEVAYMNSVQLREDTNGDGKVDTSDAIVCDVPQIGTELFVKRGKVTFEDPPNMLPPNRKLDLDQAVVTFPALDTLTTPTAFDRRVPPTPKVPTAGGTPADWLNLQYLPSLKDHHSGSGIKLGWRGDDAVNGRLVLRGGKLEGSVPTDPGIQKAQFEFTAGGVSLGKFAGMDRLIYTVEVPGSDVELVFTGSKNLYKRLKLEPPAPGQPVKLLLSGLHDHKAVSTFAASQELKDFCTFYALLEPRPKADDWLKISYAGPAAASTYPPGAQPSPGFFCLGDGF